MLWIPVNVSLVYNYHRFNQLSSLFINLPRHFVSLNPFWFQQFESYHVRISNCLFVSKHFWQYTNFCLLVFLLSTFVIPMRKNLFRLAQNTYSWNMNFWVFSRSLCFNLLYAHIIVQRIVVCHLFNIWVHLMNKFASKLLLWLFLGKLLFSFCVSLNPRDVIELWVG